jgi:hypothetical protein
MKIKKFVLNLLKYFIKINNIYNIVDLHEGKYNVF